MDACTRGLHGHCPRPLGDPNALHWQLDVLFREDAARNRKDYAPANIAILRRRALYLAQGHIQGLALDQTQAGGLERRVSSQSS